MPERMYDLAFVRRVLEIGEKYELQGDIYWRCGPMYGGGNFNNPASFFVNTNDLFWWACADLEEITPENVEELERACSDCKAAERVVGTVYGPSLFACRVRGMRPQGAAYPKEESLWPLFDATGPIRENDIGNPKKHPRDRAIVQAE